MFSWGALFGWYPGVLPGGEGVGAGDSLKASCGLAALSVGALRLITTTNDSLRNHTWMTPPGDPPGGPRDPLWDPLWDSGVVPLGDLHGDPPGDTQGGGWVVGVGGFGG